MRYVTYLDLPLLCSIPSAYAITVGHACKICNYVRTLIVAKIGFVNMLLVELQQTALAMQQSSCQAKCGKHTRQGPQAQACHAAPAMGGRTQISCAGNLLFLCQQRHCHSRDTPSRPCVTADYGCLPAASPVKQSRVTQPLTSASTGRHAGISIGSTTLCMPSVASCNGCLPLASPRDSHNHPIFGFCAGLGAMLAAPLGALRLMLSMALKLWRLSGSSLRGRPH